MYRQCKLEKNDSIRVAWIPAKYAVLGKTLKLKNKDKVWENGWTIIEIYQSIDEPYNLKRIVREHRKNTGDNL